MKNSPENALKKMYTSIGRTWKDISFSHTNTFGPNFVIPDMVLPLTGNTTVKMQINSYILSQPTPTPVFDSMRVDVSVFYAPQRNYVRGLIGDNFIETREIEDFDLPYLSLNAANINKWNTSNSTTGLVIDTGGTGILPDTFKAYSKRDYAVSPYTAKYSAILPGSLLHRLGFPSLIFGPNFLKGIYDSNINKGNVADLWAIGQSTTAGNTFGSVRSTFNMSTVCAYYDICRYYLSNLMSDKVPISNGSETWLWAEDLADGEMKRTGLTMPLNVEYFSLASFGTFLNDVRGVSSSNGVQSVTIPTMNNMFIKTNEVSYFAFNGVRLTDFVHGIYAEENEKDWHKAGAYLKNVISSSGLWPTRYDSHFQTMYFDASKVNTLMQVDWSNNVQSYRLAESEFATKLKRLLRGMRYKSWVDVTFGAKVKMDDHPIMLGKDSYYLTFQDIVNTGSQTAEIPLGASVGRGVGGNKSALRNTNDDVKEYVFTTQEPGYLMVLYSVVPQVSYANVLPRHLTWTKFGDFPIPQNSGKTFEPLVASDLSYQGLSVDNAVVGQQPIYFDAMTTFNKVGGAFATDLREGYTFVREFGKPANVDGVNFNAYQGSTYVEPGVFDQNFEDQGVNGRQVFNVKTHYNIKVCVPLEDQVTDYNI